LIYVWAMHAHPLRKITAGVPQVALLSPLLFVLHVREVPQPNQPHTRIALYVVAHRFTPRQSSPALLQQHLQYYLVTLADWRRLWKFTINAEKSKTLFITKKRTTPLPPLAHKR
jgi:hypothetical protein